MKISIASIIRFSYFFVFCVLSDRIIPIVDLFIRVGRVRLVGVPSGSRVSDLFTVGVDYSEQCDSRCRHHRRSGIFFVRDRIEYAGTNISIRQVNANRIFDRQFPSKENFHA